MPKLFRSAPTQVQCADLICRTSRTVRATFKSTGMLTSLQVWETPEEMARALVSAWVIVQVLLVVVFGVPPLASRQHLGHNPVLPPLLVYLGGDLLGDLLLLGVVREDARAVLRPDVRALAVCCGGVVHTVEELEQLLVGDLGRIVDDLRGFGVCLSGKLN
jgi:hypothetical protein